MNRLSQGSETPVIPPSIDALSLIEGTHQPPPQFVAIDVVNWLSKQGDISKFS